MLMKYQRAALGMLLAVQGAFIIAGAVIQAFSVSALLPLDQLIGADASIAAVVLGAAFIMGCLNPTRAWVNLAILYEGLTIVTQLYKYFTDYGTRLSVTTMVVSGLFLIGLAVFYPRNGEVRINQAVPA
jgi:hypothetical protein